jgi:hypothetical protein
MKIQFGLKCPHGRSAAIIARSPFDVGHDRTPSIGEATSYQCCGEALDLGSELANLAVGIAEELTQQKRFAGYVLRCHGGPRWQDLDRDNCNRISQYLRICRTANRQALARMTLRTIG